MRPERPQTDRKPRPTSHVALKQAKRNIVRDQRVKEEKEERDRLRELERTKEAAQKNSGSKN